ncbi:MAG: glycerate kinase [Thermodesulfobacteriota bacterium]|nr:glycerate kinase [Thermodesulfobacteriota bacterium]
MTQSLTHMTAAAKDIFSAALTAVAPKNCIHRHCRRNGDTLEVDGHSYDLSQYDNIYVIGAGKASAAMAAAVEELAGDRIAGGVIIVKYGYTTPLEKIRLIEGGHPLPDDNGLQGAGEILETARMAGKKDLVICLISGGGSALMPVPAAGISLHDKQKTMDVLLSCGATISEINTIRKHISAVKGGRLAEAVYPAALICLIISDVVGDDPSTIASGPTVPDAGTFTDCLGIIEEYGIAGQLPEAVMRHVKNGLGDSRLEPPKEGAPAFKSTRNLICGGNREAIDAARDKAAELGFTPLVLSTTIQGETAEIAKMHAAIAKEVLASGNPVPSPACILSGGETTVTLGGHGKGGRNQHFCLAAAGEIAGMENIVILSGGTDGTDGPTDAAGAVVHGKTAEIALSKGLDPRHYLKENDSYTFFQTLGDLLVTGPTNTNVMDIRIMLVDALTSAGRGKTHR